MNWLKRFLCHQKENPETIKDGYFIVTLADYESFVDKLAVQKKQSSTVIQERLQAFCAKCSSQFTQEGLSHLYLMGPKSSYRRRMGNQVVLMNATTQGDTLRLGKCPACGSKKMRLEFNVASG